MMERRKRGDVLLRMSARSSTLKAGTRTAERACKVSVVERPSKSFMTGAASSVPTTRRRDWAKAECESTRRTPSRASAAKKRKCRLWSLMVTSGGL